MGVTPPSAAILRESRDSEYTVDVERFAGLNIRGFSAMKRKYFRGALTTSVYYLPIAKNSRENFRGKLKNRENLAQRIFPRLR